MAGTRRSGRKETPPSIKDLKGTRRKWRENQNRPEPGRASDFSPPAHLDEIGAAEYVSKAELLDRLGVFKEGDSAALAAYADAYSRWVHASKVVQMSKDKGYLIKGKRGEVMRNPALIVVNGALEQMYRFLTEFGLTPASRARVKADDKPKNNEWDMFSSSDSMPAANSNIQ